MRLRKILLSSILLLGFGCASIASVSATPFVPDWVQKKVDDYHKSDNKVAGLLGLIYSLGGIVVFFSYAPQFLSQIKKNRQISSTTFALFGSVNTIGLAYAIAGNTTPLMVTMIPATFWCWLMVATNEIKKRRGDFEVNLHSLLKELKKVLDPENEEHIEAFRKLFGNLGLSSAEQIDYLVNKMRSNSQKVDEFVGMYNYMIQDVKSDLTMRQQLWKYLDTLSFPATEYDLEGKPVFLNTSFIEMTEYSKEELFEASDIVNLLYKGKEMNIVHSALMGISQSKTGYTRRIFTLTTKTGKHKTIHWTTQPALDEQGRVIGTIRFGIDTEDGFDERLDAIAASI